MLICASARFFDLSLITLPRSYPRVSPENGDDRNSFSSPITFTPNSTSSKVECIAIVYATWSGLGIFSISIISYFIYDEVLQWQSIVGLFLIIIGVVIVNIFASEKFH